jgi:hypothetical protein
MTTKRKIQYCAAGAIVVAVVSAWLTSRGTGTSVRMSSQQVMSFLGRNAISLAGIGPLHVRQALTNSAHLDVQARLLVGQKLYRLQTTNASLGQLMIALSYYANKEVMVLTEPEDAWAGRFGPFDSTAYATRHEAANAIKQQLNNANWHLLRLTDGKLMFVSEADRKLLLTGHPLVPMPPPPSAKASSPAAGGASRAPLHKDYE